MIEEGITRRREVYLWGVFATHYASLVDFSGYKVKKRVYIYLEREVKAVQVSCFCTGNILTCKTTQKV
jgi:hypothetical protein